MRTGKPPPRMNPRRQFLWAAVALISVLGGYALGWLFTQTPEDGGEREAHVEQGVPFHRTMGPPPTLVTIPDQPIFQEPSNDESEEPLRAYEEALPAGVYEPPPPPPLPPPPAQPPALTPPPRKPVKPRVPEPLPEKAPEPVKAPPPAQVAALPPVPAPRALPPIPLPQALPPGVLPPWQRFAVAPPEIGGRPMIAVVIDDMGVDRRRSGRVITFPGPLTLSFLSYAGQLDHQTAAARAGGHELLLHVPMEPANGKLDPGPHVLLSDGGPDRLLADLQWGLGRFDTYVGINNHMGSKFTADLPGMTLVMSELKARGLLFLDSRTTGRTVGPALARQFGVPFAERNVFLDNVNEVAAVKARLRELENLARRRGTAVAIAHPRDATLAALSVWLKEVEGRGFVLVPLSTVVGAAQAAR